MNLHFNAKSILALDTSTEACSASLRIHRKIVTRFEIQPYQHSHLILPMMDSLLTEAGIQPAALDAIAFGCGPGSFTGLRMAASVTQGIALAHDLPVIPISSLQAMAQNAYLEFGYEAVLAAIDAHANAFYSGMFVLDEKREYMQPVGKETLISPSEWQLPETAKKNKRQWHAVGTGWRYCESNFDLPIKIDYYPNSHAILLLAERVFERKEGMPPEKALPTYLHELNYLTKG